MVSLLHFSDDQWYWEAFHIYVCHLYVFFWEMSIQIFSPFLIGLLAFFFCRAVWVSYIFWLLAPWQMISLQIFTSNMWVASSLSLLYSLLCRSFLTCDSICPCLLWLSVLVGYCSRNLCPDQYPGDIPQYFLIVVS